jgi:hypothetical protein
VGLNELIVPLARQHSKDSVISTDLFERLADSDQGTFALNSDFCRHISQGVSTHKTLNWQGILLMDTDTRQ